MQPGRAAYTPDPSTVEVDVERIGRSADVSRRDHLAVEEPLEIRLGYGPAKTRFGPRRVRNVVRIELASGLRTDSKRMARTFLTTSSCGLCGKASLKALARVEQPPLADGYLVSAAVIHATPTWHFVRGGRFNIYSGPERISAAA